MIRPLFSSLQVRLILGVTVLFLASLWAFAWVMAERMTSQLQETLVEQQQATISYVAQDLDQRLQRRLDNLVQAATVLPIEHLGDAGKLEGFLRERPNLIKFFDGGVIVVKPDGSGAFADYPPVPGRRTHGFEYFTAVGDVIRSGRPAVGKPFIGPLLRKPMLGFAVPVRDKDGRLAAVLAGVSLVQAPDLLGIVGQHHYGRTGDFLVIAPQHGMVVIGTNPADIMRPLPGPGVNVMLDRFRAGEEGSGVSVNVKGVEQLVSGKRLASIEGWFAVARLPIDEAFALITATRQFVFAGALALSLLVAGLGALWVRRALAPLRAVTGALDAISAGAAPLRALPVTRQDEIGRLIESFNRLQERLQQREADLVATREELREITNSVPVAMYRYRIDDDGRPEVMYISKRIEALWGMSAAEIMRDPQAAFARIHPDDLPGFLAQDRADWADHRPSAHELRVIQPDGGIRWLHIEATPKRLADGRVVNHGFVEDVTARKAAEATLHQVQERFAVAFRASPIAASIARISDGRFIEVNEQWQRTFGWQHGELIGRSSLEVGVWPGLASRAAWIAALRRDGRLDNFLTRWRRKDGALRDVSVSAEITDVNGESCVLAYILDVTERLQAERALAESEARNRRMIETANEGIWSIDPDTRINFVNQRMADMLGYTQQEILGTVAEGYLYPEDMAEHKAEIARRWAGQSSHYERRFRRKDGSELWTQVSGTAIMNPDGSYGGAFAMFTDITHLKDQQRQLQHVAHYDALTGIPNRVLLADRMHLALAQARRAGHLVAVCYVDLDGFKPINDAYGHDAGDRVLIEIARRLKDEMRGGDTVARLGGDEFVLLLGIERMEECEVALHRVLEAIAQPLTVASRPMSISASVGVTLYPFDDSDPDTLLRHADQAMYGAKQEGRNRYHVFDALSDRDMQARSGARQRIAAALDAGEFRLYYQPKVDLSAGRVIGAEALIRWQHPERGLVPPGEFLPLIEDSDFAIRLSEWVIETALGQLAQWRGAGLAIGVSVNLPARHLQDAGFADFLAAALARQPDAPAAAFELEVLESAALEDVFGVSTRMEQCRKLGVRFALDDFGTGYASLAYLRRLPIELLKIDQSFIRDMLQDPDDLAIVEGVIGLATAFRDAVIAEGVETVDHAVMLLHLGCNLAQGYGIARPMPPAELPAWAAAWKPDPALAHAARNVLARADLPLLWAAVEHRHWVEQLTSWAAQGGLKTAETPSLETTACRLGHWLYSDGRRHYGALAAFHAIDGLHDQVHEIGRRLVALCERGKQEQVSSLLADLHQKRDELLGQLHELIIVVSARKGDAA